MDTVTFLIAIILIVLTLSFGEFWIVFGIIALFFLLQKDLTTTIVLAVATGIIYIIQSGRIADLWPIVAIALVIIALIMGLQSKPAAPEYYAPGAGGGGAYGDLLGGMS